jgi:hypothetical protein
VRLGVVLGRFAAVMRGMRGMTMRRVRVVSALLVVAVIVMLGRFAMMVGGILMMFRGGTMM